MSSILFTDALLPLVFLLGSLLMTICNSAIIQLGRFKSKELFFSSKSTLYIFNRLLKYLFPKHEWECLNFSFSFSKYVYLLAFAASTLIAISPSIGFGCLIIAGSIVLDFLTRIASFSWGRFLFTMTAPLTLIYLIILSPLLCLLLKIEQKLCKFKAEEKDFLDKGRLREMIRESELRHHLDPTDQKLISSFINFKERVAKEIMVPRVDLFSLSSDTSIREASRLFSQEGYSRIPIYKDTLDEIMGVVLYKDLLKCFTDKEHNLESTLETIAKPVLYSPENKKVSQLLQEFRNKQIHMAIIVDEYGGTEGIVTIEDILEELVGEIEDEYDIGEEHPFWEIPGGGWIIDAKMTLLDIADQVGIHIPTHPEYETLGGYVYHCAGTIPAKGWRISHDKFDLEVISSNERAIKKMKVQPRVETV